MAPIVHCVRHGQVRNHHIVTRFTQISADEDIGLEWRIAADLLLYNKAEHNKGGEAYLIHDPHLTEAGMAECRALETRFPYQSSIDMIVSSPLRRALETSLCSFQPAISRGVKIIALPELQETSDIACDTGSHVSDLEREFSGHKGPSGPVIDLSFVPEDWNSKVNIFPVLVFVRRQESLLTRRNVPTG
jgi:hypothetical protein